MSRRKRTQQAEINITPDFFNEKFIPLLNNTDRYTLLMGGGGSGKSVFVVQKMIIKALQSRRRVLVVRKVATTLRASIFELFLEQLDVFQIKDRCKVTTSNLKIELPNGSTFIFYGMDDPEKIKSITSIDDIVIEEVTELTLDDYLQLQIRLRSNNPNPQIHMMMNPVSKANWTYKHFFEQTPHDTFIHHSTYKDNKFLPQSYIDTLESYKTSNEHYYKIYALGEFGNLSKTVFDNWEIAEVEDKGDLYVGLDIGWTDSSAVIGCYMEGNTIYVVDEIYRSNMFIDEIARAIIVKGWAHYPIATDSAEPRSIADLQQQGIQSYPVKKGKDSVIHGVKWLQSKRIVVDPQCKNLIRELQDLTYMKDRDGNYIERINPNASDHAIDSLRYSLSPIIETANIPTVNIMHNPF